MSSGSKGQESPSFGFVSLRKQIFFFFPWADKNRYCGKLGNKVVSPCKRQEVPGEVNTLPALMELLFAF